MESRRRWLLSGAPSWETTVILQDGLNADGERPDKIVYNKTAMGPPVTAEKCCQALAEVPTVREERREVVTR